MSNSSDPMDSSLPGSSVHGILQGKNTGVGSHFLLQGIFPTQESNPGLLPCRQILYQLSYEGRPTHEAGNRSRYCLLPQFALTPSSHWFPCLLAISTCFNMPSSSCFRYFIHALLLTENVLPSALCPTFSPGFYPGKHIALEDVFKTCADTKRPLKLWLFVSMQFSI